MPIKNWSACENREKVLIIPKKEVIQEGSNVTRKIEKIIYEFCICDVCGGEVVIKDYGSGVPINGAIVYFKNPRGRKFPVILHSKCLKNGVAEINKYFEEKRGK